MIILYLNSMTGINLNVASLSGKTYTEQLILLLKQIINLSVFSHIGVMCNECEQNIDLTAYPTIYT